MARKKKDEQKDIPALEVDFSTLAGGQLQAPPTPEVDEPVQVVEEVEEVVADTEDTPDGVDLENIEVLTVETYQQLGFEEVLDGFFALPGVRFEVQRRVWNGQSKPKSAAFTGLRASLKKAGFSIANGVHANGTDGKLSSADYVDDDGRTLHVEYSAADDYGHVLTVN